MLLSVAFLVLMPRRTTWFTPFGTATMYIYLLHTFILFPFRETGMLAGQQPFWVLPAMILFCIGISVVLSLKPVRRVFRPLVEPRARWLFRPEPSTATGTLVLPPGAMPPLPGPSGETSGSPHPTTDASNPPEEPKPGA